MPCDVPGRVFRAVRKCQPTDRSPFCHGLQLGDMLQKKCHPRLGRDASQRSREPVRPLRPSRGSAARDAAPPGAFSALPHNPTHLDLPPTRRAQFGLPAVVCAALKAALAQARPHRAGARRARMRLAAAA